MLCHIVAVHKGSLPSVHNAVNLQG